MRRVNRIAAVALLVIFAAESSLLAVDSKGAAYFGGTAGFKDAKDPVEGLLDTKNETALIFTATGKNFSGQTLSIPYASVVDLEYGQKAGRRVGAAAATTILLGPIGLLTLLSKKRNHYLTVGFKDADGKDQVAVLELGKDIVRVTLPIVETRSGKKIEYQDDEARKSAK
jgi:hypothetical protein